MIYPGYARVTSASRRQNRRSSESGKFIQAGIVVTGALGIDTDLTLTYQVFAFLTCIYIAASIAAIEEPAGPPPTTSTSQFVVRFAIFT